ncbi:MAG: vanadium-dependent haloperoxidase [Thermodesulfobacteriota bacterium]
MSGDQILKTRTTQTRLETNPTIKQDDAIEDASCLDSLGRREFISNIGMVTTATLAASVIGLSSIQEAIIPEAKAEEVGPLTPHQRRKQAFQVRRQAAVSQKKLPLPEHPCNNDEDLYPNKIGSYSKGLPHDNLGEVDLNAYDLLINALSSGNPDDFEDIPLGCPDETLQRRLVNPQAGLAFDLEGPDSHHLSIPPAPSFSSAEEAGEAVELYWMALLRDIPFTEYESDSLANDATADLSSLSDFRGPKVNGQVTTGTLFRGFTPGDLVGPYLSQFLWLACPFGANFIEQKMHTLLPGIDYMTQYSEWLNVQSGCVPQESHQFDSERRYIRNGRDLAQWVHVDVLFQAYFQACLILLTPPSADPKSGGIGAPLNAGNPYNNSRTQDGFGTFGGPYVKAIMCEVATRALKAVWYQKWFVHRRLRPEVFGGRIHNHLTGAAEYPIDPDVLESPVLDEVFGLYETFLLPQVFPEGSPLHPAYGAGHATVAGACVTILKALFEESFIIPNPVVVSTDGLSLDPYTGPELTVGGELSKLAANIAIGRNFAGIHWRSDYTESLILGEAVAIGILRDQRLIYNENFNGFTFTKFDGTTITV